MEVVNDKIVLGLTIFHAEIILKKLKIIFTVTT